MRPAERATDLHPTALRPFDDLIGMAEDAFVVAADCLEVSIADIRALHMVFDGLQASIGPETDAAFKDQISKTADRCDAMQTGFGQMTTATRGLRGVMADVRSEVQSLGTIVRLIANISVNARIQGNSLSRPTPQIRSFVDRLGHLSAEAETTLSDVNDAMATALDAVREIEQAQAALSEELRHRTFPAIADFTAIAQAISAEQPTLRDSSTAIATQMQFVSSDVARLVTSLQIGDTLRQRLEQIHAALAIAGQNPNELALSYRLATALAEGTLHDALPHIDAALVSLDAVAMRGGDIARTATASTFATNGSDKATAGKRSLIAFGRSLEVSRTHFSVMQAGAHRVQAQIQIILGHDASLQSITHQIRMAGINAVIACAKIGEDGRALRELAQWLRGVTDEHRDTMQRLQVALEASRRSLDSIGDDMIAGLEASFSAFLLEASDLGALIAQANSAVGEVSARFHTVVDDLGERIETSTSALSTVRSKLIEIRSTVGLFQFLSSIHQEPDISTEEAKTYLATIRRKYTMSSERDLHDRLIASLANGTDATLTPCLSPEAECPLPTSEADALADILF